MNEEAVQRCAAAQGVRVLLSGWNGDGCVSHSGRQLYPDLLLSGRWRRLIAEYRDQDAGAMYFLARHVAWPLLPDAIAGTLLRLRRGKPVARRWLVSPAVARRVKPPAIPRLGAVGVRHSMLQNLRRGYLVQRIEDWAASGARRGIEYRYPLLDRRLLEFALGLPPEQFCRRKSVGAGSRPTRPGTTRGSTPAPKRSPQSGGGSPPTRRHAPATWICRACSNSWTRTGSGPSSNLVLS